MREIIISKAEDGEKLKKLCFKYFDKAPQSFTYKMLRKKNITLNGRKADPDAVLSTGDSIKLFLSDETIELFHTEVSTTGNHIDKKSLFRLNDGNIIYECDDYIIINKPAGILSQKSSQDDYSVNDAVIDYMISCGEITDSSLNTFRPSVCNRLDRNTSGIITAGKTLKGLRYLSESRLSKLPESENKAVVSDTPSTGSVKIITGLKQLKYNKDRNISLVECTLYTGKSHQIRVTLQYLGFPVVGDVKYGNRQLDRRLSPRPKRQLLHAYKLILGDNREYTADIPEDMNGYMEFPRSQRFNL